jgi:hypothetical protein
VTATANASSQARPTISGRGDDGRVGDEQVVADNLDAVAESLSERNPAVPVGFGEAVFDAPHRDNG